MSTSKLADVSCSVIVVPEYIPKHDNLASPNGSRQRYFCFDLMRVFACYMVLQSHSSTLILKDLTTRDESITADMWYNLNSICRADVPLFMMVSGYFLFPVQDAVSFYRRRFSRVGIPFAVWSVLYAIYYFLLGKYGIVDTLVNIPKMVVSFIPEAGHLWFIYSLLGMYLYAPVLSPWVMSTGPRMMELYLVLWMCSLTLPYLHYLFPEIWRNADMPVLHYFSGNLGYIMLASYIKQFHIDHKSLYFVAFGSGLALLGYALTVTAWLAITPTEDIHSLEVYWLNLTPNVAMMTAGFFIAIRGVNWGDSSSSLIHKLISDVANKSYGMYLSHHVTRDLCHFLINKLCISVIFKIPLIAVTTFILTYCMIKLISFAPCSKFIIG